MAATFLFRGSQGKKNKFPEEKRGQERSETNCGRYGRRKVSAEAGASPAEIGKVSEVIGSGREACESQEGCGVNAKLFFTWVSPEASLFGLFQLFIG